MWILFGLLAFIGCSNVTDEQKHIRPSKHPEEPETAPCKATHDDPFKCVIPQDVVPGSAPYSLVVNGKLKTLPYDAKIPKIPHNFFQLRISSEKSNELGPTLLRNLFVKEIDLSVNLGSGNIERHYWEPDPSRWSYLIARKDSRLPLANIHGALWINKAWDQVLANMGTRKVEFFTRDGCAGHCLIRITHPTLPTHRILEVNEYVGGLSIRHQVLIEERSQKLLEGHYALIEVDPSGSPNLVYLFDQYLTIFSRTGETLHIEPWQEFGKEPRQELHLRDRQKTLSVHSIVTCDAGILPSKLSNFRVGNHTDKSFWGWLSPINKSDNLSLWEQLSGVYYLSDINYGYDHGNVSIRNHHESVAYLATNNTNISIIPISADLCFSHYKHWKNNVLPFAKIISVSSTFSYDFESCQSEPRFKDSIGDPEKPFLWVLGAGNDYLKNLISRNTCYCPQSLGPKDNMIIVASTNAAYSNDGVDYADIAADGTNSYSGGSGTSFATPRVARVAAMIAKEFPSLSIAQIKQAIMQGAYVPTPKLANRSGGILDEAGARRIAKQLSAK